MKKYKVSIKSSSSYLPLKVVTNFDIAKKIDTSNDWIYKGEVIESRAERAASALAAAKAPKPNRTNRAPANGLFQRSGYLLAQHP